MSVFTVTVTRKRIRVVEAGNCRGINVPLDDGIEGALWFLHGCLGLADVEPLRAEWAAMIANLDGDGMGPSGVPDPS